MYSRSGNEIASTMRVIVGNCTFNSLYNSANRGTAKVTRYDSTTTTITIKMADKSSTFFNRLKNELVVF